MTLDSAQDVLTKSKKQLYLVLAAVILAIPASYFIARCGIHEGRVAAYHLRLAQCRERFPRYRCEVELNREYPDMKP